MFHIYADDQVDILCWGMNGVALGWQETRPLHGQAQYQDEGEKLRAQGVPADVIAGMRNFNAHGFAKQPHGPVNGSVEFVSKKVGIMSLYLCS